VKALLLALIALAPFAARAQSVSLFDDFSAPALDSAKWQFANEDGTALATASTADATLTVNSVNNRSGAYATSRIGLKGAVQVKAMGWSGTNQILQLCSAPSGFSHFIEYGAEQKDTDGTPFLHVWIGGQNTFSVRSPVTGPSTPSNPTLMRIERDGTTYRFFANSTLIYTAATDALDNDPRVMLYGWQTSVGHWDDFAMSGPAAALTTPSQNGLVGGGTDVVGSTGPTTASWKLEVGYGASPQTWIPLATGSGPASGTLAHWTPDSGTPPGTLVFRLSATDAAGMTRSAWNPVTMLRFALAEPFEGQRVGPSFPVLLAGDGTGVQSIAFQDNGVTFATVSGRLNARCVPAPGSDGPHVISALVMTTTGATVPSTPVNVTVQRDLYGSNARVADDGPAFVMPNGQTTVLIGENDGTMWPGCWDLWQNNNLAATESYVAGLAASGVNCMRIMLEDGGGPAGYIENPLGSFNNARDINFWDQFLPMCSAHNMTVLLTPWDTFWMNRNWSTNPYNSANGGPCVARRDFIVSPVARAAQKARFKYLIDRWGNSSAIFAYDLLNEFDIWWDASDAERKAWVDDMAQYVQDYEFQKWGHRHMVTVSTAAAQPGGIIGDVQYRHPRFEFSNTHQYYDGTVNNPQNIIDPIISVNGGVKYSLEYIQDGRPYFDSESGPIANWPLDQTFDNQYYHHMAWAHFASGGTGIGQRWPYRNPHYLTPGMHATQKAVSIVAADIDWTTINTANADNRVSSNHPELILMACGDTQHAVIWLTEDVRQAAAYSISGATLTFTGLAPGRYCVSCWNPNTGGLLKQAAPPVVNGAVSITLPTIALDMAVTIRLPHKGDVTGDGLVNMADVVRAMRFIAGMSRASVDQGLNGDIDGNGSIDVADAVRICQSVNGLNPL
jgi:mannan endo-1,4-beta-mannosidase